MTFVKQTIKTTWAPPINVRVPTDLLKNSDDGVEANVCVGFAQEVGKLVVEVIRECDVREHPDSMRNFNG